MPEISVLVPAYNAEKTIQRTIKSILNQSFSDFEVIVVNDGSSDQTEKTVLEMQHPQIRYFKKENGGIAETRNYLLEKAQGKYVSFLDADDWMEPDTLEWLHQTAVETQAEAVVCDYRYVFENGDIKEMPSADFGVSCLKQRPSLLIEVMPQMWNKLILKETLDRQLLKFPKGLVFEDLFYWSCLLPQLHRVAKCNHSLINYYQLQTSIMASARKIKPTIYDFDRIVSLIDDYYQQQGWNTVQKELEGLFALNARELVDGIIDNQNASLEEKTAAVCSVLNTLNRRYPKWFKNSYYVRKYEAFGKSFLFKRRLIDWGLARGKVDLVLKQVSKS